MTTTDRDILANGLEQWLRLQRTLQVKMQTVSPKLDGDPLELEPDAVPAYILWNSYALTDELHEATAEIGWKPWATSRHVNAEQFFMEMVDAMHFFANMLLAAGGTIGLNERQIAQTIAGAYLAKRQKNLMRQVEGYDGVSSKCPQCHRELSEVNPLELWDDGEGLTFCNKIHCDTYHHNKQITKKEKA